MTPKDAKKIQSHYVPQSFLRGFTQERLFVYNKERGSIRETSPKGVAYEFDFYVVDSVDGEDSLVVEKDLSRIENVAIPLLKKFKTNNPLTNSEWADIAIYMAIQYGRTPTARKRADDVYTVIATNEIKFHLVDILNNPGEYTKSKAGFESEHPGIIFPNRKALKEWIMEPGPLARFNTDNGTFVKMFFEISNEIAQGLLGRRWKLLQAPSASSFITSDNPLALLNRKPLKPFQNLAILVDDIEVYMPINSTSCLAIDDKPNDGKFMRHNITKSHVRAINELVAAQASKYVISGHKTLLESLTKGL